MKKDKLVVAQVPDAPVEKTVLAKAIVDISAAMTALSKSGLNRRGIVILAAQSSKQPQYVVQDVLNALEQLRKDYCA